MPTRKVMVIGLDAVTFELMGPWADEGRLPNLACFLANGASGPLRSTLPPSSPAAWSTFATGMNPGQHGILGFHQFHPERYEPQLMNAAGRRGTTFWEIAGRHGVRGGVINLPFTYPPREYNGFLVAGILTPSVGPRMASPREVFSDLKTASPRYAIDVDLIGAAARDPQPFLSKVIANLEARLEAAVGLYRRHRPELFCTVFVAADRICHYFWPYLEAARAGKARTPAQRRLGEAIETVYRKLDEAVGTLVAEAGEETDVLIVSDHGAGAVRKGLSLRKALAKRGLLVEKTMGHADKLKRYAVMAFARRAPRVLKKRAQSLFPNLSQTAAAAVACQGIDFSRSKAYPTGSTHGIFVNLKGRQPCGIVRPGSEYEAVREQIITALSQLRDPDTGRPALQGVYRREEVWSGPCVDRLPDLVVQQEEGAYAILTFAQEKGDGVFYELPKLSWTSLRRLGDHRSEGVLMAMGPHIKKTKIRGAEMADVPATILALLGCPIPEHFEGRVLSQMLTDNVRVQGRTGGDLHEEEAGDERWNEGKAAVERRLTGLGYL